MPETYTTEIEMLSPRSFAKLGSWLRETVTSLANDVGQAILEDLPDFYPAAPDIDGRKPEYQGEPVLVDLPDVGYPSELIALLSNDASYLTDPTPPDNEDFDSYLIDPLEASELLEQFPSLRMRIEHYKLSFMVNEEERILKRILFKMSRLKAADDADVVVVDGTGGGVLVEDEGEFVAWD